MKSAALVLALVCAAGASAQSTLCTPGAYAQYKDKAATDDGLRILAREYCGANAMIKAEMRAMRETLTARSRLDFRGQDACLAEMKKMRDAATAAGKGGDFDGMTKANPQCQPEPPAAQIKCRSVAGKDYILTLPRCPDGSTQVPL